MHRRDVRAQEWMELDWAARLEASRAVGTAGYLDIDDLHQMARMALWGLSTEYDPSRGQSFYSFVYARLGFRLRDLIRPTTGRNDRRTLRYTMEFDALEDHSDQPYFEPGYEQAEDSHVMQQVRRIVRENHTERNVYVLDQWLAGRTGLDISRELGLTEGRVSQILKACVDTARRKLGEESSPSE